MTKHPRVYPPEFRHKVLELIRSGKSTNAVAIEFNISRQTLTNWLKQDGRDSGRSSEGLTTQERDEVTALRKKVKQLELEREILKKAAAWFARETDVLPPKSSNS